MYELVKNALSSLNMTLYQYTRLENKAPCIVMNYITSPELYSDNTLKGTTYTVMLNVISTSNIQKTNEEILKTVAPDSVEFSATSLKLNGMDTKMMAVHKYPLNVNEGWLVDMFAIPSSSCVMNLKPVPTAEAKSPAL